MKKIVKVSSVVLVVAILVVLAVPAMAGGRGGSFFENCSITLPYWDKNGNVVRSNVGIVWGDLEAYEIDGGIVNVCRGEAPLGEDINQFTYLTFDELCVETEGTCNGVYYLDYDLFPYKYLVVDPETKEQYTTSLWDFTIEPDGDEDFTFTFTKKYYFE